MSADSAPAATVAPTTALTEMTTAPTLADIAAALQGYDPQSLTVASASAFLQQLVQPITGTETLPLRDALGRVLAGDVVSPLDVPAHDNSAMDGYAFDGSALVPGAPLTLRVVGKALAGAAWTGHVGAGECVKIMTGAVMPAGLDTVVPQEFTQAASAPAAHSDGERASGTASASTTPNQGSGQAMSGHAMPSAATVPSAQKDRRMAARVLRLVFCMRQNTVMISTRHAASWAISR